LKTIRYLVLMSVLSTTALLAQSYTFEAASVKPASPDNPPGQGVSRAPGGRFTAVNAPLRFLIMYGYQLRAINWSARQTGSPTSASTSSRRWKAIHRRS